MADPITDAASGVLQMPNTSGMMTQRMSPLAAPGGGAGVPNLQHLLASGLISPETLTSLLSTQVQPTTPQAPVRRQLPETINARPTGSFATVGERKRADTQALAGNIAGAVKSAMAHHEDVKIRAMSMDTERLMSAFQGMNEAQASGDQKALQHNQTIINDMMSDPKKVKQFQKVFNVNLLGEGKDKNSPEYKGFVQAYGKFKQDAAQGKSQGLNPVAEKLMQQMPQRIGADPRLQAMMEAVKSGVLPKAGEQLQAQVELTKVLSNAQQKGYDRESKESIAKLLATTRDRGTQASLLRAAMQNIGRTGVAEIVANASRYRADKAYQSVIDNPHWKAMSERLKSSDQDKSLKIFNESIDKQLKALTKQKEDTDKLIQKDTSWFKDKDLVKRQTDLQKQIETLNKKQNDIVNYYMQTHDQGLEDAIETQDSKDAVDYTQEELEQLDKLFPNN